MLVFASRVKSTVPVPSSVQIQEELPCLVHAEPSTTAFAAQRHNKRESGNMLNFLKPRDWLHANSRKLSDKEVVPVLLDVKNVTLTECFFLLDKFSV